MDRIGCDNDSFNHFRVLLVLYPVERGALALENLGPELALWHEVGLSLDLGRGAGRDQFTELHPFWRYFVVDYLALRPSLEHR